MASLLILEFMLFDNYYYKFVINIFQKYAFLTTKTYFFGMLLIKTLKMRSKKTDINSMAIS